MIKAGWILFMPRDYDPWDLYKRYAEIGYKVQDSDLSRLPGDLGENYKRYTDLGLTPITVGCPNVIADADVKGIIARAKAQNITRVTMFGSSILRRDERSNAQMYDDFMGDIEAINGLIPVLAEEGLTFAYHNHFQEFTNYFKGAAAFEHMLIKCDPRLSFDLDVGWASVGGQDPVKLMQRLQGRIAAIHLKDFFDLEHAKLPNDTRYGFTSLGSGAVNLAGVIEEMDKQKIPYGIVEQDMMRNLDNFEAIEASYLRMKESGFFE